ncbi:MAG: hypothetical protein AAB225_16095 [Acidobacteriota bacterium]
MRVALFSVGLVLSAAELFAAGIFSYARQGNIFTFKLADGSAELEWISASSFRFCRRWQAAAEKPRPISEDAVAVAVSDLDARLELATKYLKVEVAKEGLLLKVRDGAGALLAADAAVIRRAGDGFVIARETPDTERFRGLGVGGGASADGARGVKIQTGVPFLLSSLGYGEYYRGAAGYLFDLASTTPGRRRVELRGANRVESFFYHGPTPKEILEQHVAVSGGLGEVVWADYRLRDGAPLPKDATALPPPRSVSWEGLRETLRSLYEASYSAILLPAFDASPFLATGGALARRAAQLASVMPVLYQSRSGLGAGEKTELAAARARLVPYLVSYGYEADDRGFPLIRPMAMQYPRDKEAAGLSDQFLLGDDLLVAPILGPDGGRSVYLPMGAWTDLRNNQAYKGRQTIQITAGANDLPLFAKNGSIVPLAPVSEAGPLELHYFPSLAAELFYYEEGTGGLTQFHAAPAAGFMRLEIEPVLGRTCEWVVHHVEPCRRVVAGQVEYAPVAERRQLRPGAWHYDARRRNLHVQVRVRAGADSIINVSFADGG